MSQLSVVGTGVIGNGWISRALANGWDVVAFDPAPDAEARYAAEIVLDLTKVSPHVAGPDTVGVMRPVAEIQFMGFVYPAINQLFAHAARLRNRTRGRLSCPMVLRAAYGGGIGAPEHHSESYETIFLNTPGFKVVVPSNPYDANWPGTVGSNVTFSSSDPYWNDPNMSRVTKLVPA